MKTKIRVTNIPICGFAEAVIEVNAVTQREIRNAVAHLLESQLENKSEFTVDTDRIFTDDGNWDFNVEKP